jgi:hypothetical protein
MNVQDFKYLIIALFGFAIFFSLIMSDYFLALGLIFIILGSYSIGQLTKSFHKELETKDDSSGFPHQIRWLAALIETTVYSFLFASGLMLLVAGYLVIRNIGNKWGSSLDEKTQTSADEGKAVAVFRIGYVLQLSLAIFAAYFIHQSQVFHSIIMPAMKFLK